MPSTFAFTPIPPSRSSSPISALVGNWRGELIDGDGGRERFTFLRDASSDAAVAGRFLFFATRDIAPTGVKLLEASSQSFVALVGPYFCPRENTDVLTVFEGIRRGDQLEGTFYTRVLNWRDAVRSGRFVATRADITHRAA
jgi:hypothetical protein